MMRGYRTYVFAVVAGVLQICMILGYITSEEAKKAAEALETLSVVLAAVFLRMGVKRDTGNSP